MTDTTVMWTVQRLQYERKLKKMTQADLGKKIGTSAAFVSQLESGTCKPSEKIKEKLYKVFIEEPKKRGRPRKITTLSKVEVKKEVTQLPEPDPPKRKRGRPRKVKATVTYPSLAKPEVKDVLPKKLHERMPDPGGVAVEKLSDNYRYATVDLGEQLVLLIWYRMDGFVENTQIIKGKAVKALHRHLTTIGVVRAQSWVKIKGQVWEKK